MFWVVWVRVCEFSCLSVNPCDSDRQEVDTDSLRPPDTPKSPPTLNQLTRKPCLNSSPCWQTADSDGREIKAPGQRWLSVISFYHKKKRERKKTCLNCWCCYAAIRWVWTWTLKNIQTGTVLNPSVLFKWDDLTIYIIPTCVFDSQSFKSRLFPPCLVHEASIWTFKSAGPVPAWRFSCGMGKDLSATTWKHP